MKETEIFKEIERKLNEAPDAITLKLELCKAVENYGDRRDGQMWKVFKIYKNLCLERQYPLDFSNMRLNRTPLFKTDLSGANFRNTLFNNVNLEKANLDGCDFSGATFSYTKLRWASLKRANFQNATLGEGTDLSVTNLEGCDFSGAKLHSGIGIGCNLQGAMLINAKLTYTFREHLKDPFLSNLRGAITIGTEFTIDPLSEEDKKITINTEEELFSSIEAIQRLAISKEDEITESDIAQMPKLYSMSIGLTAHPHYLGEEATKNLKKNADTLLERFPHFVGRPTVEVIAKTALKSNCKNPQFLPRHKRGGNDLALRTLGQLARISENYDSTDPNENSKKYTETGYVPLPVLPLEALTHIGTYVIGERNISPQDAVTISSELVSSHDPRKVTVGNKTFTSRLNPMDSLLRNLHDKEEQSILQRLEEEKLKKKEDIPSLNV